MDGGRGPRREGGDAMNGGTVTRATWALAQVLKERCLGGDTVVVGRDARHHSDEFATATAEVLAAQGFTVVALTVPAPTPVGSSTASGSRAATASPWTPRR